MLELCTERLHSLVVVGMVFQIALLFVALSCLLSLPQIPTPVPAIAVTCSFAIVSAAPAHFIAVTMASASLSTFRFRDPDIFPILRLRFASLFISLPLLLSFPQPTTSLPAIGVAYPYATASMAEAHNFAAKMASTGLSSLRLRNPDFIPAFMQANLSIFLDIPSRLVQPMAVSYSFAARWVYRHIPFAALSKIQVISLGHTNSSLGYGPLILPALKNFRSAMSALGNRQIAVSTPIPILGVLDAVLPSTAEFKSLGRQLIVEALLREPCFILTLRPEEINSLGELRHDYGNQSVSRNALDVVTRTLLEALGTVGQKELAVVLLEETLADGQAGKFSEEFMRDWIDCLKSGCVQQEVSLFLPRLVPEKFTWRSWIQQVFTVKEPIEDEVLRIPLLPLSIFMNPRILRNST